MKFCFKIIKIFFFYFFCFSQKEDLIYENFEEETFKSLSINPLWIEGIIDNTDKNIFYVVIFGYQLPYEFIKSKVDLNKFELTTKKNLNIVVKVIKQSDSDFLLCFQDGYMQVKCNYNYENIIGDVFFTPPVPFFKKLCKCFKKNETIQYNLNTKLFLGEYFKTHIDNKKFIQYYNNLDIKKENGILKEYFLIKEYIENKYFNSTKKGYLPAKEKERLELF
ncbi:hypothetical protein AB836_01295 [Rickettsiales bacterium (ex Bugula neritina AB1)]|nr:hypothetical protein AB836_01295 [Rickettsiales bacterium (ex Bugula neritina AB1)]